MSLGETVPYGSQRAFPNDPFSMQTAVQIITSSRNFSFFVQCCVGILARGYNGNSLCLQRAFPSFWCLLITSPFRCTQFPALLNSCDPTSSLLSSTVNTYARMFVFFSLSPGIIPVKDVKPLCKIEFKSFPL